MKKTVLLSLLITSLFAEVREISSKKTDVFNLSILSSDSYISTYCIDGYVWQKYTHGSTGNLVQVFENKTYEINNQKLIISKVKTCH